MNVQEIMNKNVITLKKESSIKEAAKLMVENDIGSIIIIDSKNHPLGIITDRDIITRVVTYNYNLDDPIENYMTRSIIAPIDTIDIIEAISIMSFHQIKRLILTNNQGELTGLLSISNIALYNKTSIHIEKLIKAISKPNPQKEKPLKYLKADSFRL